MRIEAIDYMLKDRFLPKNQVKQKSLQSMNLEIFFVDVITY